MAHVIGDKNQDNVMNVKFWGVRGSIPTPLTSEQIIEKSVALIERIHKDGGIEKLFTNKLDQESMIAYLCSLPLSLSGTYGGETLHA